ncbi:unnamed protein product [Vitrella brassicaformis CCMP3155]|uniref:Uncharacterized protein n=1 Tax=Vitrella brassicaformis (strain CCMP3155) TaxID=1169540 RepID=A0A0G4GHY2_VITBC|nr:unnamed protein product [Vitrella brassicaformis CCMP3155]|eukprot:CEM29333.1 unnamed protein product [Vitrella brassicaformis CCMP3155]
MSSTGKASGGQSGPSWQSFRLAINASSGHFSASPHRIIKRQRAVGVVVESTGNWRWIRCSRNAPRSPS